MGTTIERRVTVTVPEYDWLRVGGRWERWLPRVWRDSPTQSIGFSTVYSAITDGKFT